MPCHQNLEAYLEAYIDGAGLAADPKGPRRFAPSGARPNNSPAPPCPVPTPTPWSSAAPPMPGASKPKSATIAFAPRASRPISRTAGRGGGSKPWGKYTVRTLGNGSVAEVFRPRMPGQAFYGVFLREIFACNHIPPGKWFRPPVFHATNRGSNVGDYIAKHAACSGDSGPIIARDLLGNRRRYRTISHGCCCYPIL